MNRHKIKRIIARAYPEAYKQGTLILNYHSVHPAYEFAVKPAEFQKQMEYAAEHFEVLSFLDAENKERAPGVRLVITFDDGYDDNFLYAFPILQRLKLPHTIFITTDFVFRGLDITKDWQYYRGLAPLSVEQLKVMTAHGVSIGSHSQRHLRTSILDRDSFIAELSGSRADIQMHLGTPPNLFAFPFGQKCDRAVFDSDVFLRCGYKFACTTDWGINSNLTTNPFALRRIRIDHTDTIDDFKAKLLGKWDFVRYVQSVKNIWCRRKRY